jgi:hypothetical protein
MSVTRAKRNAARTGVRSKYGNKKTVVDGITFDSKKEAARYQELKLMERAGVVKGLSLQRRFRLEVNGIKVCDYVSDFHYFDMEKGDCVTEDVKGVKTPIYNLKKKLMWACYGIEIQEI